MTRTRKIRIVEFLIVGVVMGTLEDLLAVFFATDAQFTWHVLIVVFLVALPFAFLSEVVVDHPNFWKRIWPEVKEEVQELEEDVEETLHLKNNKRQKISQNPRIPHDKE